MRLSVASLRRVVKRDLTIQFVSQALTSYGGLELLGRYLRQIELGARLRQAFAGLRSDYGSARIALVLLALLYVGARRLEHLCYLSGDPLVTRFCGLARLPSRRTVADWLRQFTQETLAPLIALNRDLVTEVLARLELPRLTIDVDGSVVRTGATVGWAFRASTPIIGKTPATTRWSPMWHRPGTSSASRIVPATSTIPSRPSRSCGTSSTTSAPDSAGAWPWSSAWTPPSSSAGFCSS
jgi:hypothetical protein